MVERIRLLLETRQLTPTQFADAIGIARPIVSHILSGRNKPSLEVVQRILAAMPDLSMPWLLNGTGPMQTPDSATVTAGPAAVSAPVPASGPASGPASEPPEAAPAVPVVELPAPPAPVPSAAVKCGSVAPPVGQGPAPSPTPGRPGMVSAGPRRFAAPSAAPGLADAKSGPVAAFSAPLETPGEPLPDNSAPARPDAASDAVVPGPSAAPPAAATALLELAEKPIRRIVIFYRDGSFADYQPE